MKVHTYASCLALAATLCMGGSALAQRRAPGAAHRGAAIPRQAAPGARARTARPSVEGVRPYDRPYDRGSYYRPAYYGPYYRPYYRSTIGLGIYIGYPYGYYPYPYGYYSYPPPYAYPYPGPYGYGGAAVVSPDPEASQADEQTTVAQPPASVRGLVAILGAPSDATIYVDGNYAGRAADFSAAQPLSEPAGYHQIEIRAAGHRPVIVHLDVQPNRTLTYQYPAEAP